MLVFANPDVCTNFYGYFTEFYLKPENTPWKLERNPNESPKQLFFKPTDKDSEQRALNQFHTICSARKP